METSDVFIGKVKKLQQLENKLAEMQGIYGPDHPDVKAIDKEIKILRNEINKNLQVEAQVETSDVLIEKGKRLRQLENQLAEMQGIYGPDHPDIKAIKSEIAILKLEVEIAILTRGPIIVSGGKNKQAPPVPSSPMVALERRPLAKEIPAFFARRKRNGAIRHMSGATVLKPPHRILSKRPAKNRSQRFPSMWIPHLMLLSEER